MRRRFCDFDLFLLVSRYLTGIGCRLDLENVFFWFLFIRLRWKNEAAEFWSFPNSWLAFHITKASRIVLYACGSEYDDTIRKTILVKGNDPMLGGLILFWHGRNRAKVIKVQVSAKG